MAKVLQEMPKISRAGGGRKGSKYPLDEWFDGNVRELVEGEDYECKKESLINMLHGKAATQGVKIHTVKTEDGFALVAFTPEDEEASENGNAEASANGASEDTDADTEADADEE